MVSCLRIIYILYKSNAIQHSSIKGVVLLRATHFRYRRICYLSLSQMDAISRKLSSQCSVHLVPKFGPALLIDNSDPKAHYFPFHKTDATQGGQRLAQSFLYKAITASSQNGTVIAHLNTLLGKVLSVPPPFGIHDLTDTQDWWIFPDNMAPP